MTDFELELEQLRTRIDDARRGRPIDPVVMLSDLETAHEELRVADEEVRVQRLELDRLMAGERLRSWQHERLLAVLPAAVLVTDQDGRIHTVNAAASSMLRLGVGRMIRKPLLSFVAYSDRAELRRALAHAVATGSELRTTLTILPRKAAPRTVEVVGSVSRDPQRATVDVTWLLIAPTAGPAPSLRAVVELTRLQLHTGDHTAMLRQAASICADALGPEASVTVMVGHPMAPTTLASSDNLAQHLDGSQVVAGEGPTLTAWQRGETVVSDELPSDSRWPDLAARLEPEEVRGVVAVPLLMGDEPMGVLNVYYSQDHVAEQARDLTTLLGAALSAILHETEIKASLGALAAQLRQAMASRAEIEQAKGVVMATHSCSADEAFRMLASISSRQNTKLRDVAARIAAEGRLPSTRHDKSANPSG
jgi:AmiR/NasT family two-component response regulator